MQIDVLGRSKWDFDLPVAVFDVLRHRFDGIFCLWDAAFAHFEDAAFLRGFKKGKFDVPKAKFPVQYCHFERSNWTLLFLFWKNYRKT